MNKYVVRLFSMDSIPKVLSVFILVILDSGFNGIFLGSILALYNGSTLNVMYRHPPWVLVFTLPFIMIKMCVWFHLLIKNVKKQDVKKNRW